MREVEFLPDWYPLLRRRRRVVMLQAWLLLLLLGGLGFWLVATQRSVYAAETTMAALRAEQSQIDLELEKLDRLLELQQQWRQQERIINQLGPPVEVTRLIHTLEQLMPQEMALLELTFEIDEKVPPASNLAGARKLQEGVRPVDRRLRVRLRGVAPTGVDLANFLMRLSDVPFFEQVSMAYSRDRHESGHVMREFELSFALNLNLELRSAER